MAVVDVPFRLEVTPVTPEPTFRGEVDPVAQAVPAGTVATYLVRVVGDAGFVNAVGLAVVGLPDEATWNFEDDLLFAGESTTLSIVAPVGVYDELMVRMTEV